MRVRIQSRWGSASKRSGVQISPVSSRPTKTEPMAAAAPIFSLTSWRPLGVCSLPSRSPVPFAAVETDDGRRFVPGQANNAYIFPGVGLGLLVSRSRRCSDKMFFVAAGTLAGMVEQSDLDQGRIFPPLSRIREVSAQIAVAVAQVAYEQDLAQEERPADLQAEVESKMFHPDYPYYA